MTRAWEASLPLTQTPAQGSIREGTINHGGTHAAPHRADTTAGAGTITVNGVSMTQTVTNTLT